MSEGKVLYVATGNAGKLRDFAWAAEGFARAEGSGFRILPLPGLARITAPSEDADTFLGNALSKAIYYSRHAAGELVIADDSGLEVDALKGAPGVYSARYAERAGARSGHSADELDGANNAYLLAELARALAPVEPLANLAHRTARYRCVLAVACDGVCICTAEGRLEGQILLAPQGQGGFGYDPLFYLPALGQTMAELDSATRLRLSHRGEALRALLSKLGPLLQQ